MVQNITHQYGGSLIADILEILGQFLDRRAHLSRHLVLALVDGNQYCGFGLGREESALVLLAEDQILFRAWYNVVNVFQIDTYRRNRPRIEPDEEHGSLTLRRDIVQVVEQRDELLQLSVGGRERVRILRASPNRAIGTADDRGSLDRR